MNEAHTTVKPMQTVCSVSVRQSYTGRCRVAGEVGGFRLGLPSLPLCLPGNEALSLFTRILSSRVQKLCNSVLCAFMRSNVTRSVCAFSLPTSTNSATCVCWFECFYIMMSVCVCGCVCVCTGLYFQPVDLLLSSFQCCLLPLLPLFYLALT